MMNPFVVLFLLATVTGVYSSECVSEVLPAETVVRATVELVDGSRLSGRVMVESLTVALEFAEIDIPLQQAESITMAADHGKAVVKLTNGDRLTGVLLQEILPLETILGPLQPPFSAITSIDISKAAVSVLPAGTGPISFGGFHWVGWRTGFEIRGDTVFTLPRAADGFNYGHGGHGRGGMLYTNIGSKDWKDYRAEFTFCIQPADPSFNRYGIGPMERAGYIRFHVADARQSWNEKGMSSYSLFVGEKGSWGLGRSVNWYVPRSVGYADPCSDSSKSLARGEGFVPDPINGNRYVIEVKGQRIRIYVDGDLLVDVEDPEMHQEYDGIHLGYGGVGVEWLWENMGWMRDFSASRF